MAEPALKYKSTELISTEEYLRLETASETKHEFLAGEVIAMAGATEAHNRIVANIVREVGSSLKDMECDVFPSDFRVTTPAGKSYFYPDVSIVCGEIEKQPDVFDTLTNPMVILEVMSESTENSDRGYKFFHYQQIPSLQEYILIDSREQSVDVIRRQTDGAWKFETYKPEAGSFSIQSIGLTLRFEDLYYRVSFSA